MKKKLLVTILAMTVAFTSVNPSAVSGAEVPEEDSAMETVQEGAVDEVQAEESVRGDDDADKPDENGFVIKDGVLVRYEGNAENVVVPDSVTSIGDRAFSYCGSLSSIELPSGLTSIGYRAFYYCSRLSSIELPTNLTSIGEDAFLNCSSLGSIELPSGVTSIGVGAFSGCSSLEEINVNAQNKEYCSIEGILYDKEKTCVIECPGRKDGTVTVENGVTSIADSAFYGCSSLSSIELPNSVTSIGYRTFNGCSSLSSIELPSGLTSIADRAFFGCSDLKEIVIPDSVINIGDYAISSRYDDEEDDCVYTDTTTIYCHRGSAAASYASKHNIPLKYLEDLERTTPTITVSAGTAIEKVSGDPAFSLGVSTNSNGTVTYTSDNESVAKVDAKGNVTIIGAGTATITIATAKTIAFEPAEQKVVITVKEKTNDAGTSGGNNQPGNTDQSGNNNQPGASDNTQNTETPANTQTPSNLKNGTTITDKKSKVKYVVTNAKKKTVEYKATTDKKAKKVTVPSAVQIDGVTYKVTSVAKKAFYKNKTITSVTIGKNVTTIADSAFEGCTKLRKVTVGSKTTKIGAKAFKNCKNLETVKISSGSLKSIGKQAFTGTKSTMKVTVPAKKLTAYKKLLQKSGISKKAKIQK